MNREAYSIRWKLYQATAALDYSLECFGDHLAEQESYPDDIDGFDAIYQVRRKTPSFRAGI